MASVDDSSLPIFPPASVGSAGVGPGLALDTERAKAKFSVPQLSEFLYGAMFLKRQSELRPMLEADPVFRKWDMHFQTRLDRWHRSCEKVNRLWTEYHLKGKLNWLDPLDFDVAGMTIDDLLPIGLHFSGFMPPIESQGTDEQRAKWIPLSRDMKIIGTYVQTEVGHGSFLRGLETTATYDPATQEFELNCPHLSSAKYWPGGLARTVTHALLMANLVVAGRRLGPHAFIVPLRSLHDHQPLPGVTLGDIGPKYGFETVDNGYLRLAHVRVPRDHMLARYAEVTPDGRYVRRGNEKLSYGSMVYLRSWIIEVSARSLARAATVVVRYSAVRKQFYPLAVVEKQKVKDKQQAKTQDGNGNAPKGGARALRDGDEDESAGESAILNYPNQQWVTLPWLATSYALQVTGRWMTTFYNEFSARLARGDTSLLAEIHAITSGLKSLCSSLTSEGIESCRRACGGHGFSKFSGLVDALQNQVAANTYEGENQLMYLQAARYLMKHFTNVAKTSLSGDADQIAKLSSSLPQSLQFLATHVPALLRHLQGGGDDGDAKSKIPLLAAAKCPAAKSAQLLDGDMLVAAYQHRVASMLMSVAGAMHRFTQSTGRSAPHAFQAHSVDLIRCARAYGLLLLVARFQDAARRQQQEAGADVTKQAMAQAIKQLADLFALYWMERDLAEFLDDGYLSAKQAGWVRAHVRALLMQLRQVAVPLVDAWNFSDHYLNSALGRHDGNVYEALLQWASKDPTNQMSVPTPLQEKYLLSILRSSSAGSGNGGVATSKL